MQPPNATLKSQKSFRNRPQVAGLYAIPGRGDADMTLRITNLSPPRHCREKVCACGKAFTATRSDAKHCSAACRQQAYRRRKAQKTPPHIPQNFTPTLQPCAVDSGIEVKKRLQPGLRDGGSDALMSSRLVKFGCGQRT